MRLGLWALTAAVVGFVMLAMLHAAPADAQAPAICDQYPNLPQCVGPGGGDDSDAPPGLFPGGEAGAGPSGDAGGAELPFTGYPLTGLVLLLLVLLAMGLLLRAYLAGRDRLRSDPADLAGSARRG